MSLQRCSLLLASSSSWLQLAGVSGRELHTLFPQTLDLGHKPAGWDVCSSEPSSSQGETVCSQAACVLPVPGSRGRGAPRLPSHNSTGVPRVQSCTQHATSWPSIPGLTSPPHRGARGPFTTSCSAEVAGHWSWKVVSCQPLHTHHRLLASSTNPASTASRAGSDIRQLQDGGAGGESQPQGPVQQLPGLFLRHLPSWAVPYAQLMRLEKPTGTWVLLWPCVWSISLAAQPGHLPDLWMLSLFAAGAVLLRGAGCTVNDLWDRDLDAKVARTRSRPLASGALKPMHGLGLLGLQLSLGLLILLQLNDYSKLLGASSLLLVGSYPLMKRFTYWPQAYLGLTINWGALLGWAAVRGSCDWGVVLPLYAAGVCWSIVYDTIYAHQDKRDDAVVGVRSTALLFGDNGTRPILTGFTAAQAAALCMAGNAASVGPLYYAGVAAMAAHLLHQVWTVDINHGPDCQRKFASNREAGAIMALGCIAGRLWP